MGQWPWPRTLVAKLVERIAAGHPRVLGVDIIFAEPDRFSPNRLAEILPEIPQALARELALLPSSEMILADAFRKVPTVLGEGVMSNGAGPPDQIPLHSGARNRRRPARYLPSYPGLVRSLPELTAAERGRGVLVGEAGPRRNSAPRAAVCGRRRPPGAVDDAGSAAGGGRRRVTRHRDCARDGVQGATAGRPLHTHRRRGLRLSVLHPVAGPTATCRRPICWTDPSIPASLRGGIWYCFGVTGLGLVDEKQTPLGLMPGVEVGAQFIESILTGNLLRRPAAWISSK